MALAAGDRIQKQERDGCNGRGLVVVDIPAPADVVFDTLTRFSMYQDMIPTVRASSIISNDSVNTVAEFTLSRFMLRVNVIHKVYREDRVVKFNLDDSRLIFGS